MISPSELKDIQAMLDLIQTPQPPERAILVDRATKKLSRLYAPKMMEDILDGRAVTTTVFPPRFVSCIKGLMEVINERSEIVAAICGHCGNELKVSAITPGDDRILSGLAILREAENARADAGRTPGDDTGAKAVRRGGRPKGSKNKATGGAGETGRGEGKEDPASSD